MAHTVLRRIAAVLPLILGMTVIVFSLLYLAPGDPAEVILRSQGVEPTPETVDAFHEKHGLDRSPPVRYLSWMGGLFRGDLGVSFRTGDPVRGEFFSRFGATVELALASLAVSLLIALPLGVVCAVRLGSPGPLRRPAARTSSLWRAVSASPRCARSCTRYSPTVMHSNE